MRAALTAVAVAAAATIAFAVASRDPEEARSVAVVVVAFGILVGALTTRSLAGPAPKRGSRGRTIGSAVFRRGAFAGLVAGGTAFLRVIDGLTPLTAAFLVLGFAGAEYILSTRRVRSRR